MSINEKTSRGKLPKANVSDAEFFEQVKPKKSSSANSFLGVRPTKRHVRYRPWFAEEVTRLMIQGLYKWQIAAHFDVSENTMRQWTVKHPEFCEAMGTADRIRLHEWLTLRLQVVLAEIVTQTAKARQLEDRERILRELYGVISASYKDVDPERHPRLAQLLIEAQVIPRRIASLERKL
jgi:hypothetical protein